MDIQVAYHHVLLVTDQHLLYMGVTLSVSLISRPDSRPDSRQDSRTDSRQDSRTDSRQDSRPDSRPANDRANDRANDPVFDMRDYMEGVFVTVVQCVNEFDSCGKHYRCGTVNRD